MKIYQKDALKIIPFSIASKKDSYYQKKTRNNKCWTERGKERPLYLSLRISGAASVENCMKFYYKIKNRNYPVIQQFTPGETYMHPFLTSRNYLNTEN